jgi:glycosyltransferase involved in cell wall biosynthesis/SAM-dependent methyltransferase
MLQDAGVPLHSTGVAHLYSPGQVPALTKLMRRFDIVHVHLFPAQLWAVLGVVRLSNPVPLVTTEHGTSNYRRRWWLRSFDAWLYRHYLYIACNSDATAAGLIRWCPSAEPKVRVIQNGVPLDDFETAQPAEAGIPPNVTCLVFVGRFEPPKDHATVLRALAAIPKVHLLLVGDGPLRSDIEKLAHSLGVKERVSFLGRRQDVARILKASDIYVHSATFDGFGIAACEAMAAGLPVIASDVPGLADVVHGAGALFPVGDHAALVREIQELLASPQRRCEMSKASLKRAQSFSIDRTVDGYLAIYESALQPQRQTGGRVMNNVDPAVVKGFGQEWSRFDQTAVRQDELQALFDAYFAVFPWGTLPPSATGFDLGCGSGRWAQFVAPLVGRLYCIDPSPAALDVARKNLKAQSNCEFHCASVDAIPLPDGSADFGYSLGVLHHIPDTQKGIMECVGKLKPGAPFLLYLYYAFDNRPWWFRLMWRISDILRRLVCRLPFPIRSLLTDFIAGGVYWPAARLSRLSERLGISVEHLPLSAYRDRSFYSMRTDALDRFGTRLEKRFTREQMRVMMEKAGLERIVFSETVFWCAVGWRVTV